MKKLSVFICIVLLMLLFTSCDGDKRQDYIIANDYLEGSDQLRINIKLKKVVNLSSFGGNNTVFFDDISIQSLSYHIDNSDSDVYDLDTNIYQNEYILIKKTDKSTNKLLYYMLSVKGNKNFYCPIATLNNKGNNFDVYMPYHLFVNVVAQKTSTSSYFNIDDPFKTIGTIDDFYTFYDSYDRYDVEKLDDKLIIEDNKQNVKFSITFTYKERVTFLRDKATYVKYEIN